MLVKKKDENQLTFDQTIEEQVNQKHPLFVLSHMIDWKITVKQRVILQSQYD